MVNIKKNNKNNSKVNKDKKKRKKFLVSVILNNQKVSILLITIIIIIFGAYSRVLLSVIQNNNHAATSDTTDTIPDVRQAHNQGKASFLKQKKQALKNLNQLGAVKKEISSNVTAVGSMSCPVTKISDLSIDEQYPKKGPRHMVTPPEGGELVLVCCTTTKGPLSILAHKNWAPIGAQNFLDMVSDNYFNDANVPMMRCMKNFLCQFGLSVDSKLSKKYRKGFADDPSWLPLGKDNRQNSDGVERFAHGYLAYAGGGKNSRGNQFIASLKSNGPLAGGSPWEVPWGELVREYSFDTLSKIYTGYGENGPSQGKLMRLEGTEMMNYLKEFPNLDYITGCSIVDRQE